MNSCELWYYRTSQASTLEQAIADGCLRKHDIEFSRNLLGGTAADAVALILQAADMMEHEAEVAFALVVNGEVIEQQKMRHI